MKLIVIDKADQCVVTVAALFSLLGMIVFNKSQKSLEKLVIGLL